MKPAVLITQPVPDVLKPLISQKFYPIYRTSEQPIRMDENLERFHQVDGIICFLTDQLGSQNLSDFKQLKVIGNVAAGYNNLDIEFLKSRSIIACNTPGVLSEATADLALNLLLSVGRKTRQSEEYLREGKFDGWNFQLFLGVEFFGKTCGIIGMGKIGQAFARRVHGMGMKILYHNRTRLPEYLENSVQAKYVNLETLLESADVVSVHTPLTLETRHLLDESKLMSMKKGAILINTSRGEVIDEGALVSILKMNHLFGAGLDVFEHEPTIHPGLLELENVVLTPHIGSATLDTRYKMFTMALDDVHAVLNEKNPLHRVV